MILVTVGTMLPFDRMVRAMDVWAAHHPTKPVFAQVGDRATYVPQHMQWASSMPPLKFSELVKSCDVLVAHAGTGSFFLAAEWAKPIVLFPRLACFKEHTSDHQVDTARWLSSKRGVFPAMQEEDLDGAIGLAISHSENAHVEPTTAHAPPMFIARIRRALLS